MVAEAGRNIAIKMNDEFIARLDKLANRIDVTRTKLMKNFIQVGIEELEEMKSIGFFQLGLMVRDVGEAIQLGKMISDQVSGDKPIPIKIDDDYIDRLDALAEKAGLSRHQLMKNLLDVGVIEFETMDKVGVMSLMLLARDLHGAFKRISSRGEKALKAGHE